MIDYSHAPHALIPKKMDLRDTLLQVVLPRPNGRALLLGLDNSGKTTVLHLLSEGIARRCAPSLRASTNVILPAFHLQLFDLCGMGNARRRLWDSYLDMLDMHRDACVFCVDSVCTSATPSRGRISRGSSPPRRKNARALTTARKLRAD